MGTKQLAILIGAIIVAASPPAWAQGNGYLGLSLGQTRMKACQGAPSTIACDEKDTALRFFGGYQFTPYLAAELGGNFLGTASANTGESADLSALDVSAVASWPLGNRFALFGRLGFYLGQMETPNVTAPAVFPAPPRRGWRNGENTDFTLGIGASYSFTERGAFRVEWQRFNQLGASDSPKMDIDVFSIGALYRL